MEALLVVVNIFLVLVALVLIVVVLMQQGNTANLGAISGGAETFFGKNKAKSYEGKLLLITKICATVFIVLAISATAITARLNKTASSVPTDETPVADHTHDDDDDAVAADDDTDDDAAEKPTAAPTGAADENAGDGDGTDEDAA